MLTFKLCVLLDNPGFGNWIDNDYYHTFVIATEKLSNSEAKPRCYDNFEGDNNRVVIFLINSCCDHFKIERSFIGFSFLFFVDNYIFKGK